MTTRCKAFFNGLEVQVEWEITRSHGTVPDVGRLVFRQGGTLPSSFRGDLVLKYGDTTVVTFKDCLLKRPQERFARTRDIVYQIFDRRVWWKTAHIHGQYNVRDDKNLLITKTAETPRGLATLLFESLGEADYDVSALPDDAELAPHVYWHYEPSVTALERLCALYACTVAPMNNDTFKIVTINSGTEPDNVGLKQPVEQGLVINTAPDNVIAYAGDTWFESWLCLEAIGRDFGGDIKPIEMLSYMPSEGWKRTDPKIGFFAQITLQLRGTQTQARIDKTIEIANSHVFRMFRVVGFPNGQMYFPGFTLESSIAIGALPATGDSTKVYQVTQFDAIRTCIWDGTKYVGVTCKVDDNVYVLINPEMLSSLTEYPVVTKGTRETCETARTGSGNAKLIIVPPRAAAIDYRLLLPYLGTRIESATDELGNKSRRKAELCGLFFEDDSRGRNKSRTNLGLWKRGLSIDNQKGHITLGSPAYQRVTGGYVEQPELYIRVGYGYRTTEYGNRYHRAYTKSTGNTLGIPPGTVPRTDVNEYRIQNYTSDYANISVTGTAFANTSTIDTILEETATENIKQYQTIPAPKRKIYTPIKAIELNGVTVQVSYAGGQDRLGETVASIGESYELGQTPAKIKSRREMQSRLIEQQLMENRDQQEVIRGLQPKNDAAQAFDASNIA